jgi:hypothetical protein
VDAFVHAAREGVCDKQMVVEWVELAMDGVMEETISYHGFMDIAGLWVLDAEVDIGAVAVCASHEILMKMHNLIPQMPRKTLYIFLVPLTSDKLFPS